jgi:F-box and WD-40 domain protein CDC4
MVYLPSQVLSFVDDPVTLARASQVSKRWRELLNDDLTWKLLCDKHAYRRMSNEALDSAEPVTLPRAARGPYGYAARSPKRGLDATISGPSASAPNLTTSALRSESSSPRVKRRPKTTSYRSHFKQKYMVEAAWRKGGESIIKHITPDQGVVTSLHLTEKYIVVALDNAKIHVFNTVGDHQRTLQGHVMGVWAMVPWGDMLVSGGCDRDVRVWNMVTG